jgi:enamine deaminase RidA (YjgF/YER057c/UK114 family)
MGVQSCVGIYIYRTLVGAMGGINPWGLCTPEIGVADVSRAVVPRQKQVMYVTGQIAEDPKTNDTVGMHDLVAQMRQVFENTKSVLREGGFTLAEIVKTQTVLSEEGGRQMRDPLIVPLITELIEDFFCAPYPIHSFWVASELAHPEYLIEMEVTAVRK